MKRRVKTGDVLSLVMPWSEVCMHLGVAGHTHQVEVKEQGAQILQTDSSPFSFPITHGEAGIYQDAQGLYIEAEE